MGVAGSSRAAAQRMEHAQRAAWADGFTARAIASSADFAALRSPPNLRFTVRRFSNVKGKPDCLYFGRHGRNRRRQLGSKGPYFQSLRAAGHQTVESIALSSQAGSASWAMTAEMGQSRPKCSFRRICATSSIPVRKRKVGGGWGGRPAEACLAQWTAGGTAHRLFRSLRNLREPPPIPASRVHPVSISLLEHVPSADLGGRTV